MTRPSPAPGPTSAATWERPEASGGGRHGQHTDNHHPHEIQTSTPDPPHPGGSILKGKRPQTRVQSSDASRPHFSPIFSEWRVSERPRAPRGLTPASRRRWKARVDEFAAVGKLTPAVLDSLSSWALSLDSLADARERWAAAGSPGTTPGSVGQEGQHPLAVAVQRAQRLEAQSAPLERMVRRVPADAIPEGGVRIRRGNRDLLIVDGVEHTQRDGEWVLSAHERMAADGFWVRWVDEDGVPRFESPMGSIAIPTIPITSCRATGTRAARGGA